MKRRRKVRTIRRPKASMRDILSLPEAPRRVPSKWRTHFSRLTALREALLRSQSDLTQDAAQENPSFSTHMADAGTDSYDRDLALSMLSSEQDALYQIDQALARIRNGTYGICELTGKKIAPERLMAIPWTRFSAQAERQLEKEGEGRRTRLGPREAVVRTSQTSPLDEFQ
jgi:RNA polymerase-binding transcription factor DksA